MPTRAARYLVIPPGYAAALDRMRWSVSGDAVLIGEGQTFAVAEQVWQFLEGLMTGGAPLPFPHVLHLMHLLGLGSISLDGTEAIELRRAVLRAGRQPRNAGVFCAHLCRDFPRTVLTLTPAELRQELFQRTTERASAIEVPPLIPAEFQRRVVAALANFDADEMLHWLKFGQPPEKAGERIAEVIEQRPPNVEAALARAAENRERLAGALALVPALNGALTLPPRRLDEHELPVGGYADVTTRGEPERLLPTQFALEGEEFIRRFAEHELLFFRREEPGRPTQEELVIVLDQGVRTWGGVRLALAGAVFAFARLARRRGIPLRIAATSTKGALIDPMAATCESVAELLEASDLTPNPAAAMATVLDVPSERLRDIVLLTHPRSLTDEQFATIADHEREGDRLFAVSVDSQGRGRLDQLREGRPLALSQFRLDLVAAETPAAPPKTAATTTDPQAWRGDVEPVPFPFWFGPLKGVQHLAFDHAGEWLLVATNHGLLHAQSLDGTRRELLPRGFIDSQVLNQIDAVLGVPGGFVVCGKVLRADRHPGHEVTYAHPVAFHYHLNHRAVRAFVLPPKGVQSARWYCFPDLNSVACRVADKTWGIDLGTGAIYPGVPADIAPRAKAAADRAHLRASPPPHCVPSDKALAGDVAYYFRPKDGELMLSIGDGPGKPLRPMSDGRPALGQSQLLDVQQAGGVIAVNACVHDYSTDTRRLLLLRDDGAIVREFATPHGFFRLSDDGILVARNAGPNEVMVHDTRDGVPRAVMLPGRCHTNIEVTLGPYWLEVNIGEIGHWFQWGREELRHATNADQGYRDFKMASLAPTRHKPSELSPLTRYDSGRFLTRVLGDRLRVEADRFGHMLILDAAGARLIAVFWFRRDKAAAWLPDGTRWGAPQIVGTPSADAAAKLAQALRRVS